MTSESQKTLLDKIKDYGTIVAILASFATLLAVAIQLTPKSPELTLSVKHIENLTALPGIPQLEGAFSFNGKNVKDLLSTRLQLTNTGNVTIIGKGNNKNVIGDSIGFLMPEYVRVLEVVKDNGSFDYQVDNTQQRTIGIQFEQWRPGEEINIVLYVEGIDRNDQSIAITPRGRDLIDGELIVLDQSESGYTKKNPIREIFGKTTASVLKVIAGMGLFFTIILYFFLMIEPFNQYKKRKKWFEKYSNKFDSYVDSLEQLNDEQKESVKKNPRSLSKLLWDPFEGPEIEKDSFSQGIPQTLMFTAFFTLIFLGSVNLLVGLYLY